MDIAIVVLIFGPSIVVFLVGCGLAAYRTFVEERRRTEEYRHRPRRAA